MINQMTMKAQEILRPTHVEVNLAQLTANYRAIQAQVGAAAIMPILKANAYGHGLVEVAQHLAGLDVAYIGVAFLEEGILLREAGIRTPILVLGGIIGNQVPLFLQYDLTLTASSVEKLSQIETVAAAWGVQAKVHLKIDTGMERIGVHYYSAGELLHEAAQSVHCQVEGIYSHFANSDSLDLTSARVQLARFQQVLDEGEQVGLRPRFRHMANSGAIVQLAESYFDMVRPGLLFYGVYPDSELPRTVDVAPALIWKSRVVYFKVVQPGHPVSYGSTWVSDHSVRLVTVPVGYGDGYFRALSGKTEVIIRGRRYPVVGRICMDQMMVNIEGDTAYNGDEVILLGQAEGVQISCNQLAEWAGTIPYEILTNINTRVPRVYVQG
ncbi:MAG: alanine racemase [Chloroflexi bacterium]|nr:alanine racemase [Chloroflexota bacterium]MBP8056503.1 alanine racemase [Chloroflexota bacterium]